MPVNGSCAPGLAVEAADVPSDAEGVVVLAGVVVVGVVAAAEVVVVVVGGLRVPSAP
jgi:hypothetical protein